MGKTHWEIFIRKRDRNGKLMPFSFIKAYPEKKWQFALKTKNRLIKKGFQVLLKEVRVIKEEKLGPIK